MRMGRLQSSIVGAVGLLVLLGVVSPLVGQDDVKWGTGAWELAYFTGQLNDEPEFGPERGGDQFLNDAIYGGRAGYVLPANIFFQGEAAISFPEIQPRDGGPRIVSRAYLLGGSAGYNFQPTRRLQIFVSGGAEAVVWDPDGFDTETDFGLKYGTGARYFVTPEVALRGDLGWHQVRDALQDTRAQALGVASAAEEDLWAMELSGGVSLFLGGPKDSDGDGVYDDADVCPDTPTRVIVNDRGCPVDGDGDGVPDGLDRCPGTERGATVDDEGCPRDADGDRVVDGVDECPDTPARATVDESGCPSDSDGDGVLDGLDRCPDTPEGAEVDETGCPTGALGTLLRDFVSELNRLTVWFDFAESELWEDSRPALNLLGRALAENPDLVVEVQGHTDAVGPEAYNERLARERAEAVRAYLMEEFDEVEANQISVRSFGETRPAAPNETDAGRQKNRRAMVVVVEPRTED
jgi:OOP family OmpA-OmpF porin